MKRVLHGFLITEYLLQLLQVNVLGILLHDDGVQWVTKLVRDSLSHKFGALRLGNSSLEVDAAGHTGELEYLAVVLTILVLSGLYLHILLFIKQALEGSGRSEG